jgi:hypothetical protein
MDRVLVRAVRPGDHLCAEPVRIAHHWDCFRVFSRSVLGFTWDLCRKCGSLPILGSEETESLPKGPIIGTVSGFGLR